MISHSDILSEPVVDALGRLRGRLERREDLRDEIRTVLSLLADLPPDKIAQADRAIANAASLYLPYRTGSDVLPSSRSVWAQQLLQTPGLEYLFLFHRDGRVREAALLKITGGLPTPFLFAAVLWRLNDWAAEVRAAAVRCADRSFPTTAPDVIARTATALLVRQSTWGRWNDERTILDRVLVRHDVAEHLAGLIAGSATGPLASLVRYALRTSALDPHLKRIALEATQPAVRAVALHAIIWGEAEWPSGYAWEWIDKSMGIRRRVIVSDRRPLVVDCSREAMIARGIEDRSAIVRRVALDGVMRYLSGTSTGRGYAAALVGDRSASVRERAEFILR